MKVQIVYLSSTDDFDSTRDMLGWIQAPRALLVWPDQGRVLSSRYELVRIHRYAQSRNIQIGLLTFDSEVRGNAKELNLPTFDSLDDLPEERWKVDHAPHLFASEETLARHIAPDTRPFSERPPKWAEDIGKSRTGLPALFILGAVLFVTAFVAAPSAEIDLSPQKEDRHQSIRIALGMNTTLAEEELVLPIDRVELEISDSATLPATGWTNVPTEHASGEVVFTNHSQDSVSIPSNTILRSLDSQVNFRTLDSVYLPGGVGATVGSSVVATTPGEIGNVAASAISAIEGPIGLLVSVINQSTLTGGLDKLLPMVTVDDFDRLDGELKESLINKAHKEISSQIGGNKTIVQEGIWIVDIIETTFNHDVGEVGELLEMSMRVKAVALTYHYDDMEELIVEHITQSLPEEKELITNSLEYDTQTQVPIAYEDNWDLLLSVEYQVSGSIDPKKLSGMIKGRSTGAARELLYQVIPDLEESSIAVTPKWFPIMPLWRDRIVFRLSLE